jgi:LPXTG-site transpeptidase (sortase) family protein
MLIQKKNKNNKKIKNIKKSHLLLIGSLLVFFGIVLLSYNHLLDLRNQVFSEMLLLFSESSPSEEEEKVDVPSIENVSDGTVYHEENIDYDKYLGVIEIPRIGLKRGFYNTNSKYNSIDYNVTLIRGSTMPDVSGGNLMLMAHSGDAYISYFAYLYRLNIGNNIYITYNKNKYTYKIVNIYNVDKNGKVPIYRNYDKTTLTLITCTKDDSTKQTVYIAELV